MKDDSIPEFLRNVSTIPRICTYTKDQARSIYRERRKSILDELKIREVQRRAIDKILGRKRNEVDLVFFRRNHDLSIDDMSSVLSSEVDGEDEQVEDSRCILENASGDPSEQSLDSVLIGDTSVGSTSKAHVHMKSKGGKEGSGGYDFRRFLDLEAEESGSEGYGECSDEEDGEYLDDPTFIAEGDEEYGAPVRKHNEDLLEMSRDMLKKLKRRFSRKPRDRSFFDLKSCEASRGHMTSDEEDASEEDDIKKVDKEFMFSEREELEYAADARLSSFEPEPVEFSCDVKSAERKFNEGKRGWTFDINEKKMD